MLNRLTITTRIALGFACVLALMALLAWRSYGALEQARAATHLLVGEDERLVQDALRARAAALNLRRFEKDLLLSAGLPDKEQEYAARWEEHVTVLTRHLDALEATAGGRHADAVRRLRADAATYLGGFRSVASDVRSGRLRTPQQGNAALAPVKDAARRLELASEDLARAAESDLAAWERDIDVQVTAAERQLVGVVLVSLLLALAIGAGLTRSVTSALAEAVAVARRIGRGDLREVAETTRRDEVGTLLRALKEAVDSQRAMARLADQIAAGDLSEEPAPRSEHDVLARAFAEMIATQRERAEAAEQIAGGNLAAAVKVRSGRDVLGRALLTMIENLQRVLGETQSSANALASAVSQILASLRRNLDGAQSQAAAVQESTASASELQQTVQVTEERAREVQEIMTRTLKTGQTIRAQVDGSAEALARVQDEMQGIQRSIQDLGRRNGQIGEIIESVSEIADQTQLLAINAGIEAAKAGDVGKGFAVVAGEMRALAEQSKKAARRIRTIVGEVQQAAAETTRVADVGQERFREAMEPVALVLSQVEQLTGEVEESGQALREILAIVKQQVVGIEQITEAMRSIRTSVQDGVAQGQQLEAAAATLDGLSQQLRGVVREYRL